MNIALSTRHSNIFIAALRLPRGGTFAWRGGRGSHIEVHAGRVWMTRSGAHGDDFVAAGQSVPVGDTGTVVIECDSNEPAQVSIVQPRPALLSRLLAWLRPRRDGLHALSALSAQRLRDIGAPASAQRAAAAADALEAAWRERVLRSDPSHR